MKLYRIEASIKQDAFLFVEADTQLEAKQKARKGKYKEGIFFKDVKIKTGKAEIINDKTIC